MDPIATMTRADLIALVRDHERRYRELLDRYDLLRAYRDEIDPVDEDGEPVGGECRLCKGSGEQGRRAA